MPRISRTVVITLVPVLLALGLAACSPLGTLNALTPGGQSERTEGLSYGDNPRQKLDVYRPLIAHGTAPVVVFFYGGNWVAGERADYAFIGRAAHWPRAASSRWWPITGCTRKCAIPIF